ncbi:MAG: hypothetical protein V4719_17370, partial [Planctomycetota bacterium]
MRFQTYYLIFIALGLNVVQVAHAADQSVRVATFNILELTAKKLELVSKLVVLSELRSCRL